MAFGDIAVDEIRKTDILPGTSLLAGLLGNALGWDFTDTAKLARLQQRIRFAARLDRRGSLLHDFQTADLSVDLETWHPLAGVIKRTQANKEAPAILHKYYRADAAVTVVLTLREPDELPTLDALAQALVRPARPLFLGRCCCPPAEPLFRDEWVEAADIDAALLATEPFKDVKPAAHPLLERPATTEEIKRGRPNDGRGVVMERRDLRDFLTDVHAGVRFVVRYTLPDTAEAAP